MKKIYFSGIGGIGMSALARFFLSENKKVLGSDAKESDLIDELKKEGAKIFIKQKAENITPDIDLLVYSEAVPEDNPERMQARKLNTPEKSYFQALGDVSAKYKTIAIAGTHGKSTTTAMTGLTLANATVFVGTKVFEWDNKNFRKGNSDLLVVEACEYRNSFLNLSPYIAVITSIEPEHLDFFKNAENYFASFKKFIQKSKILVADLKNPIIQKITKDYQGKKIDSNELIAEVPTLKIGGQHNIENASKVLGIFQALDLPLTEAKKSLANFQGTWRRMQKLADNIYDDYGHHPTEIRATLRALREKYPQQKIYCVFQPHQYSRTYEFLNEFADSFGDADFVLISNIYRVRDSEEDVKKVSAEDLVKKIGAKARYTENFEKTVEVLKQELKTDDVLITIGAGPVNEVAEEYIKLRK